MIRLPRNLFSHSILIQTRGTLVTALLLLAACGTTEPKPGRPVGILLGSTASPSTSPVLTTSAPLRITTVRLVVTSASLGTGDQFGCVDCQGNAEEAPATPRVISVPLNGGAVLVATEQATPGLYSQAEISVEQPVAATLAGTQNWPAGATILIEGFYNGVAFQLPLGIVGTFRETLSPALEVPAAGAPAAVAITITLPVVAWFQSSGAPLDPSDPAQRAAIEANAQRSFQPLESAPREP